MRLLFSKFYKKVWLHLFPDSISLQNQHAKGCKSLLDVGCGENSGFRFFKNKPHSIGIEIFEDAIKKSKERKIHDEYVQMDVMDLEKKFKPKSVDCIIANGLIEHLEKKDGIALLEKMENIARKKVILTTPVGFLKQGEADGNPWQVHRSGWGVNEMRKRGYKVIGISGWKPIKGEEGKIILKPNLFWTVVSILSEPILRFFPKHSFEMLCVKKIGGIRKSQKQF